MSEKPIEFSQTRVFRHAAQRFSPGGLIGLTLLSLVHTCLSLWGFAASTWRSCGSFLADETTVEVLSSPSSNGDVHKIFFIVFLLRLSRITKLVLKAKIDEQLVFYLFAGTRKKVRQPFFILLHDNKLSLLYAGIFKTVCIIFEVMVTFLYQSYISSPCPALSNMKQKS